MKTTLLIPTVNEIEGMKIIMPRIKKEWVDEILIVDGGSTDGTLEYARSHPDYVVVPQQSERANRLLLGGHGSGQRGHHHHLQSRRQFGPGTHTGTDQQDERRLRYGHRVPIPGRRHKRRRRLGDRLRKLDVHQNDPTCFSADITPTHWSCSGPGERRFSACAVSWTPKEPAWNPISRFNVPKESSR